MPSQQSILAPWSLSLGVGNQVLVRLNITIDHDLGAKSLSCAYSAFGAADLVDSARCSRHLLRVSDNVTIPSVLNELWYRPAIECDDRSPASHRFGNYQAEWFRPVDRQ